MTSDATPPQPILCADPGARPSTDAVARQPTRRDLLIGVTGLAVGAAATESIKAIVSTSSAPIGAGLASPGEELMIEHGILKRVLLAYRAVINLLDAGHTPPVGVIADAAQIISGYVESFHEGLEEAYVFPRVRNTNAALVQTLLTQHDKGRHLTATIIAAATGDLTAPAAKAALQSRLDAFVRMYEPHEAWEDTVIYPALRAGSSQRTLDELAERFHDLLNTQFGDDALAQILQRVGGIEQQLGIADLAQFTPS